MRTKALLGLAVLAAGALSAAAQTSVYSLNVVGYYTLTVPAGKYQMIANQMVGTNYTVSYLLSVPDQTKILKWGGAGYTANTYDASFGEWEYPDMTLGPGEAAFIQNNSTAALNVTFVGEVNQNTNSLALPVGYKTASLFTPQAGNLATDFGFKPGDQDQILIWGGNGFTTCTYDASFGEFDNPPTVAVGQGVFFNLKTAQTWTRSFKVQ